MAFWAPDLPPQSEIDPASFYMDACLQVWGACQKANEAQTDHYIEISGYQRAQIRTRDHRFTAYFRLGWILQSFQRQGWRPHFLQCY